MASELIRASWAYRGFIIGSVKREFQSKYQNSLLGAAWNVLNPLAMITVYTVIFSQIMRAKLPGVDTSFGYGIYLCAGLLVWGYFSEIVLRAQNVFIENANLLKKINFPRLSLVIIIILSASLNFSIVFGLFTVFLIISGNFPGIVYIAIFPVLALMIMFAVGLGLILGVLNVFFRDVGQFFGILLQFWFWLTPIVYPIEVVPPSIQRFLAYNPMSSVIQASQEILVWSKWPSLQSFIWIITLALLFSFMAFRLFRKRSGEIVDEL